MLKLFFFPLELCLFRVKFSRRFKNTRMFPNTIFDLDKVYIECFGYGELNVLMWANPKQRLEIGNFVSIAEDVFFVLGGNHPYNILSTYPLSVELSNFQIDTNNLYHIENTNGPIIIQDDVWIGTKAIIMSGVKISQGAIIAAGAVVTKDVPPYAIVGGNPARIIKYRFNDHIINTLLDTVNFKKLDIKIVRQNIDIFYTPLSEDNIANYINIFANL